MVEDGRLTELLIDRPLRASAVGNIYLGRVIRVLSTMNAAFVEIGLPRAGFLSAGDARYATWHQAADEEGGRISEFVSEGAAVVVQVVKDAHDDKGVALTTRITLPGRFLVYAPFQDTIRVSHRIEDDAERERLISLVAGLAATGEGYILRTAAAGVATEELQDDIEYLHRMWSEVEAAQAQLEPPHCIYQELGAVQRILRDTAGKELRQVLIDDSATLAEARRFVEAFQPDLAALLVHHTAPTPIFDFYDIESDIELALSLRVPLPSGGEIVIQNVEALCAIDVNTGADAGRGRHEEAFLETNLEAAMEAARQIRLRNIGGRIVIDFVSLKKASYLRKLLDTLHDAFAIDPLPVRIGGITTLGLVELTRRRARASLDVMLMESCAECDGAGRVKSVLTVALEALRDILQAAAATPGAEMALLAAPEVVSVLEDDVDSARKEVEERLGQKVELRADPEVAVDWYEVIAG